MLADEKDVDNGTIGAGHVREDTVWEVREDDAKDAISRSKRTAFIVDFFSRFKRYTLVMVVIMKLHVKRKDSKKTNPLDYWGRSSS